MFIIAIIGGILFATMSKTNAILILVVGAAILSAIAEGS